MGSSSLVRVCRKETEDVYYIYYLGSILECKMLTLSLLAVTFWRLLIPFANSLDPDQDRQNVCPDLESNRLTHIDAVHERIFGKSILKKVSRQQQKPEKYPACKELNKKVFLIAKNNVFTLLLTYFCELFSNYLWDVAYVYE